MKKAEKEGPRTTVAGAMVTHGVKCVLDAEYANMLGNLLKGGK